MLALQVSVVIDRRAPDPSAPSDPTSCWIGMATAAWAGAERNAAVLKVATGRGTGDRLWGQDVLKLRWLGDPPPPEIAETVYDFIRDSGPGARMTSHVLLSQPKTEAQPSYRLARAG